jgi:hypothetical protein
LTILPTLSKVFGRGSTDPLREQQTEVGDIVLLHANS